MPDTLRIGLLGPLQVRDGTGHVGGRQLRVLLALEAGRVVPARSLAGQIWPGEPPALSGDQVDSGERRRLTEPLDQPGGLDRAG